MKVDRLRIKNFRSIKSAEILIGSIVGIVGKNNSGKSAILRGLNCFFNPDQEKTHFNSRKHEHKPRARPEIEILLSGFAPNDRFPRSASTETVWVRFQWEKGEPKYTYKKTSEYSELSKAHLKELKGSLHFQLIPPARDYRNIQKLENSLLKLIFEKFLAKRQRDTVSPKIKDATEQIRKILKKIESKVKGNYFNEEGLGFELNYDHSDENTLKFISNFKLKILEKKISFDPEECGTGIQSLLIIALYKYLADLSHVSYLIGIEEPEENLHPQAQRNLIEELKSLAKVKKISILATTHSPHIIDGLDHIDVVLCHKSYDRGRPLTSVKQLPGDYWQRNGLNKIKNNLFFKYKNSDFFFADKIIICEGKTDSEVILKLAADNDLNLTKNGISILILEGVNNLNYPYSLVKDLEMEYLIIVDKDFFLPYKNDSLDKSRNGKGFPLYKYEFKSENEGLIRRLGLEPATPDGVSLLNNFQKKNTEALKLLIKYHIICFRWSLEVDLCHSAPALEEFGRTFKLNPNTVNLHEEIIDKRSGAIKDFQRIEKVLNKIEPRNYPSSYKWIRKQLKSWVT